MVGGSVVEEDIIAIIREQVGSVYALELLVLVRRHASRAWRAADLVRELRSSRTAVAEALNRLTQAGLVAENPAGRYAFAPQSAKHEQLAAEIERVYASTPISVMKAIVAAPDENVEARAGLKLEK